MYCDGCGAAFSEGAGYCTSCGKQIKASGAKAAPAAATVAGQLPRQNWAEGRVRRNLNLLAGLWVAAGLLRLLAFGGLLVFRSMFFGSGWDWFGSGGWPFWGSMGLKPFLIGGLLAGGAMLAIFAAAYLVLAWGLMERQPWARILGIVLGFLILLRIPFGTALGIYTLWVLLPESSGREYEVLAGARA